MGCTFTFTSPSSRSYFFFLVLLFSSQIMNSESFTPTKHFYLRSCIIFIHYRSNKHMDHSQGSDTSTCSTVFSVQRLWFSALLQRRFFFWLIGLVNANPTARNGTLSSYWPEGFGIIKCSYMMACRSVGKSYFTQKPFFPTAQPRNSWRQGICRTMNSPCAGTIWGSMQGFNLPTLGRASSNTALARCADERSVLNAQKVYLGILIYPGNIG